MQENKMGNVVLDHTREKEGHEDLYVIKKSNGFNAKEMEHAKG